MVGGRVFLTDSEDVWSGYDALITGFNIENLNIKCPFMEFEKKDMHD